MKYRFVTQRENYEDYAGGRVLYGQPGDTAFPVRLASEIFQRCAHRLALQGVPPPYSLYDPCCGGGYLLTVIGLLHGGHISRILASDVDLRAIELAQRNLSLLTLSGMDRRLDEIRKLIDQYGKQSHLDARESGMRLKEKLSPARQAISTRCFSFDLAGTEELPDEGYPVDMVIADLPYGKTAAWHGFSNAAQAAPTLLSRLKAALSPHSVVAITANKEQVISHPDYRRVELLNIGHRRLSLLELSGCQEQGSS